MNRFEISVCCLYFVGLARLLPLAGRDATAAEQMNDVLAAVVTNTESTRNVGNAILYDAVQVIESNFFFFVILSKVDVFSCILLYFLFL